MVKNIQLTVSEKNVTSEDCPLRWSSNTVDYITATFALDDEWKSCDLVRAVWVAPQAQIVTVLDANDTCVVPHEVLSKIGKVYVNLYGIVYEEGDEFTRITTYPYNAIRIDGDAKIEGSETVPVTPSQFEQFVDAVKSETSKVTGMTATAETLPSGSEATASYSDGVLSLGIPRGAQGEKGDTGERGLQGIQGERGERGEQGLQGIQGVRGERGETGATGAKGDTGNGISSITKTGTSGLVDTYTITFTDGTSTTFNVTNGKDGSGADIDVDSALSTTSTNPVQNKVITSALNAKANASSLANVATSGNYNDLSNKPTIPTVPTNVSAFTNDAGYITSVPSEYVTESELNTAIAGKANTADLATVATSGSYADLTNKPTIPTVPTNVSAFTNDAHYITASGAPVQSVNGQTGAVTVTDTDTTYSLSISGNVITLTPSSGTASSITLPVSETEWGDIAGTLANQTDLQTALNAKQNTLTAGDNITIENNVISASGGGSGWRLLKRIDLTGINIVNLDELADYNEMIFAFYGGQVATKGSIWFMWGHTTAALPAKQRIFYSPDFFTTSTIQTMSRAGLTYLDDGTLINCWYHQEGTNQKQNLYGCPQMVSYSPDGTYPPRREVGAGITIVLESSAPTSGFLEVYVK